MLKNNNSKKKIRKEIDEKGTTRYYDDEGKLHRDDGPALVEQGLAIWYQHGQLHREGGPAIEATSGSGWYRNGKLHRDDGPAIEIPSICDGSQNEWWINGAQITAEEFASCRPKVPRQKVSWRPSPF